MRWGATGWGAKGTERRQGGEGRTKTHTCGGERKYFMQSTNEGGRTKRGEGEGEGGVFLFSQTGKEGRTKKQGYYMALWYQSIIASSCLSPSSFFTCLRMQAVSHFFLKHHQSNPFCFLSPLFFFFLLSLYTCSRHGYITPPTPAAHHRPSFFHPRYICAHLG
jgi:hypothetical protein